MLRTGLVGIGKMGLSHLALARAHPDLDVVAVCESQAFLLSALKANTGIAGYKQADSMLDEAELDCVFIATPTSSHHDLGMEVIDRGINLFVEKPLTLAHDQSRALAHRAASAGVANQVGYHNRFIGTFLEAARLVGSGAIGRVHHIDGRAFGQVVTAAARGGRTWRSSKVAGGGCLHDYACHVIDLMNLLVGPPEEVVGATLTKVHSVDVDDAVHALFRYPGGATGALETNWSDTSYRKMTTSITIYGSAGKLHVDRQECRVYLRDGQQVEGYGPGWTIKYITELQAPVDFYLRGEEYTAQVDAFAAASAARDPHGPNNFASAADTDQVVAQVIEAHEGGRREVARPTPATTSRFPVDRRGLERAARRAVQVARQVRQRVRDRRAQAR